MKKIDKEKLIKEIGLSLKKSYLFPDIALKIVDLLNRKFNEGAYATITNFIEFSNIISSDLQSINNDLHLKLKYDPEDAIGKLQPKLENRIELSRKQNFGFEAIKILKGNVGYLKLNKFENPLFSGDTLTSAMNFLGNTDALIIDIMDNPGGNIPMVELMASYFFNDRIHLSSFEYREYDIVHHTYTAPYVSGKQFLNKDLYILISKNSASAAEGFAYDLKHLKRAVIIGEKSVGAAHSGSHKSIGEFKLYVPSGQPINPNTKSNWEGVGVIPHIEIAKEVSILAAYLLALKKLNISLKEEVSDEILKSNEVNKNVQSQIDKWLKTEKNNF